MVQAMINISKETNQILNIVKAKHNLKDKSEAINLVVQEYGQDLLDPQLRPDYKTKLASITKGKHLTREEFDKEVG